MDSQNQDLALPDKLMDAISRYGQVLLIAVIAAVLALFILPIPSELLDILLLLNIAGALLVLIFSVSISDPMRLTSFSTLLLICTMGRLGLNVSSTRLILSHGEAGAVIEAFGQFVASGNLIVGAVMFILLTVVQFLVVSKGAERVAEVAARFTLDAMPGKQMSIDADLRAGLITSEEAQHLRRELVRESRLYGSLDGAMKFVKGDAIAGFIIIIVNVIGGLLIGVFQRDMGVAQAARVYTLLTVGDGLVSLIPSLLMGLAAGFLVTRVGDDKGRSLGGEIGTQLLVRPRILLIVASVVGAGALVPGLPSGLFILVSAGLACIAWLLMRGQKNAYLETRSIARLRIDPADSTTSLGHAVPLLLALSQDLYERFLKEAKWQACFNEAFPERARRLANALGIPLPELKITIDTSLTALRYRVLVFEIPVDEGLLSPEHLTLRHWQDIAPQLPLLEGEATGNTVHGTPVMLLNAVRRNDLLQAGLPVLEPEQVLLDHVTTVLTRHAEAFVGVQEVKDILTAVEKRHPELVREVVPRLLSVHKLADVIKRLVDEGVPVKDFRLILETLAGSQPDGKDPVALTEIVRMGLRRVISHRFALEGRLRCFVLDQALEELISSGIRKDGNDSFIALDPATLDAIAATVRETYRRHELGWPEAVLVTDVSVRRYVRTILRHHLPDVAVVSYQELDPSVRLEQRDTLGLYNADVVPIPRS